MKTPTLPLLAGLISPAAPRRDLRRRIWQLTWPVILANITIPLVGLVDTAVMGHLDSAHYIGAVALGSFLFGLIGTAFGFFRMATTGLVARDYGANDIGGIVLNLVRAGVIAIGFGIVAMALAPPLIALARIVFAASAPVLDGMDTYMSICALSAPAVFLNMVGLGLLFGMQRPGLCLVHTVAINGVNIAGNLFLVLGLGMKIEGVAIATVVAQYTGVAVAGVLAVRVLGSPRRWPWPKGVSAVLALGALASYFSLGRDLTIRTLGILFGEALVLNAAAAISDVALAASQLGFVLFGIIAYGLDGFAHAAESLVGHAIGRDDGTRLRMVIAESVLLAFVVAVAAGLATPFLAGGFFTVMTGLDEVLATARSLVIWFALMPVIAVLAFQMDGIFIGAVEARTMRNAMAVSVVVFVPVLYGAGAAFGLHGIWAAFVFLLGMRGITLAMRLDRVYAKAKAQAG